MLERIAQGTRVTCGSILYPCHMQFTKKNPRNIKNFIIFVKIYYVTSYEWWVYCGSTLSLLSTCYITNCGKSCEVFLMLR